MSMNQEQIAASHEFDGVRKEKERLTAARFLISYKILTFCCLQDVAYERFMILYNKK